MRSGPHQINIGWFVLSRSLKASFSAADQPSGAPIAVADQSKWRIRAPISPPPARKTASFGLAKSCIGPPPHEIDRPTVYYMSGMIREGSSILPLAPWRTGADSPPERTFRSVSDRALKENY